VIFELAQDFSDALAAMPQKHPSRRMLSLLDEAVRRDIHFIDRHPTTLFQCMWNSCWWYDCPQVAKHYIEPEGGWAANNAPWEQPDEDGDTLTGSACHRWEMTLADTLSAWREARQSRRTDVLWLRSHRPPFVALDSGQKAVMRGHRLPIEGIAFSPDGQTVASAGGDHTIGIWSVKDGRQLACLQGHKDRVRSVAFSPCGQWIVSGSNDNTVRRWHPELAYQIDCFKEHEDHVLSVAVAPCGDLLASSSEDMTIRLWPVNGTQIPVCLRGHTGRVESITFSPCGRLLVSTSWDRTIRVWDVASGQELPGHMEFDETVMSFAMSPDGQLLASGHWDGSIRLWDIESRRLTRSFEAHKAIARWKVGLNPDDPPRVVSAIAFSPDGRLIASGGWDSMIRIWNMETHKKIGDVLGGEGRIYSLAFSPDGSLVASGGADHTINLWNPQSMRRANMPRVEHVGMVKGYAFSRDGRRLLTGSTENEIVLWDVESGVSLATLSGSSKSACYAKFTEDGRLALESGEDGGFPFLSGDRRQCADVHEHSGKLVKAFPPSEHLSPPAIHPAHGQDMFPLPFLNAKSDTEVAWFPQYIDLFLAHPSRRIWGLFNGYRVYVVTLEGESEP